MPQVQHPRVVLFLALFVASAGGMAAVLPPAVALVLGFDLAALVFAASCLPLWRQDGLQEIRARALRDDGGRVLLILVSFIVLVIVLVALTLVLSERATLQGTDVALVVGTLLLAWSFSNLVYAFHYGHLYYDAEDRPPLDFPGDESPLFADFFYFAVVLGMTFQVSDVAIRTTAMRRTATLHALSAFIFNMGVMALTVNVLAGIISGDQ